MKTFLRLIQYVREYRLRLIGACLCSAGVAVFDGCQCLVGGAGSR